MQQSTEAADIFTCIFACALRVNYIAKALTKHSDAVSRVTSVISEIIFRKTYAIKNILLNIVHNVEIVLHPSAVRGQNNQDCLVS